MVGAEPPRGAARSPRRAAPHSGGTAAVPLHEFTVGIVHAQAAGEGKVHVRQCRGGGVLLSSLHRGGGPGFCFTSCQAERGLACFCVLGGNGVPHCCHAWAMRKDEASPQALGIGALLRLFNSQLAARLVARS